MAKRVPANPAYARLRLRLSSGIFLLQPWLLLANTQIRGFPVQCAAAIGQERLTDRRSKPRGFGLREILGNARNHAKNDCTARISGVK
jgi:hypothetical protein